MSSSMTAVLMIVISGFSTASAARTNRHQAKMQMDGKLNAMGNVSGVNASNKDGRNANSLAATQQTGWCKSNHFWKFCQRNRDMTKATCDQFDRNDCVWVEGDPDRQTYLPAAAAAAAPAVGTSECPFGRKADAQGDCFTGCPENSEGPDGRGNCECIQDMRCFDTSVPEEPLIPDLVDEPISGSKLPAVFEEDKSKVLLGTAVRFKKVAFIDIQIYALAVYGQYKKILGEDAKSADEMMNALLTSQEDKVLSLVFLRAVTGQQAGDGLADGLMKIGGATQEDIDEFKKHLPPQIPKGSEMRFVMKPKLGEMEFRCSVAPEGKVNLKLPSLNPAMHKVMFGPQSVVTGLPDSLLRQGQMNAARDRQGSAADNSPATQQTGWCMSTHLWKFCERNRHMDKAACDEHDEKDCVWVEVSPDLKGNKHALVGCSKNQPKKFGHTCEGCHCKARSGASTLGFGFPAAVSFLVLALEMLK